MSRYAIELYPRLEAETGQSISFHGCGSLRLACTEDELDWLRHTTSIGAALGHPMEIIDRDAIRRLPPFYQLDGVLAALHRPDDGHVDPAAAAFALAAAARQLGATVRRQEQVVGVSREKSGEWQISGENGDIVCEHVVNARERTHAKWANGSPWSCRSRR